ncbi:hypothetical protein [Mycobacterium avium]|uniref:hypothetical protein n=1 Tax=Mycobacterium avium TaxID=1764 RepID=UPI001155CB47|nr:hypothetical protein [Mycobacterium avium]
MSQQITGTGQTAMRLRAIDEAVSLSDQLATAAAYFELDRTTASHPDVAALLPDITTLITRLKTLSEPSSDRYVDTIPNRIWLAAAVPEGEQSSHLAIELQATLESDSDTRGSLAARLRRLSARLSNVGAQLAFHTAAHPVHRLGTECSERERTTYGCAG